MTRAHTSAHEHTIRYVRPNSPPQSVRMSTYICAVYAARQSGIIGTMAKPRTKPINVLSWGHEESANNTLGRCLNCIDKPRPNHLNRAFQRERREPQRSRIGDRASSRGNRHGARARPRSGASLASGALLPSRGDRDPKRVAIKALAPPGE